MRPPLDCFPPPHAPLREHPPGRRRASATAVALAALCAFCAGAARADEWVDPLDEVDVVSTDVADAAVAATDVPGLTARQLGKATTLILAPRFDSSRAVVGDANRPAQVPFIAPTLPTPTSVAARPIRVERASVSAPAAQLQIVDGQSVELHADGLPDPNAPTRDPLAPVVPRAVNPAAVAVGARWGAQDRIPAPVLSSLSWTASADVLAGAPAARASAVRRSLRLSAQWDSLDDLTLGLTPGVQRGGGTFFEHYIAGLQASTVDPKKEARWRSFLEVAGEKLTPNNIIDNTSATVRAGASYQTTTSIQVDVSVTRGTTAISDTQSSVGLSLRF